MCFGSLVPISGCNIKLKDLTIGDFMDALYENQKCRGITEMNIWKVKLSFNKINNFSTEDDVKNHGTSQMMNNPMLPFEEYYNSNNKYEGFSFCFIFVSATYFNLEKKNY